jgi:hypothetical protein
MLTHTLIHLIETHEQDITRSIIAAVRHHPELPHLGMLPDVELREKCEEILQHLGHWLAQHNDEKLAEEFDSVGRARFEESVPLHECIRGLCLIKDKMIAFLDGQAVDRDALALYVESQLVRRIGPFFDLLVVHLARGYEAAMRRAAYVTA